MTDRFKTALVTGSTSGIGKGIATRLASLGYQVMLHGFGNKEEINQFKESLAKENSIKIAYHDADLSDNNAIDDLLKESYQIFGYIDILVNNAGMQHVDPVEQFPKDQWDQLIKVNLTAAFQLISGVIPSMKQQNYGRIINIASAHGLVASANKSAYVASKHGLLGLTKVIALETKDYNITCNALCPGWVKTPLVEKQLEKMAAEKGYSIKEATEELLTTKQPRPFFTTAEQIGGFVNFLCTEDANNISGSCLTMDGGWTAQ